MSEISRSFRAMNTDVMAIVADDAARHAEADVALCSVEQQFAEVEGMASRFDPDSELSALIRSAGQPFQASPVLFTLVARALGAARASGGVFDPTVLRPLEAAGYGVSFERVADPRQTLSKSAPSLGCSWRDVHLDFQTRTILVPQGCGLDLGGIGKGWTVDAAAARLCRFANFAIDAGGDMLVRGVQADGSLWTIGVEDPFQADNDLLVLSVTDRAVATSTTARRRWQQGGQAKHHLIDPRTGQPSQNGVVSATVIAGTACDAEILAKVALLLGPEHGARFLQDQRDVEWLMVLASGGLRYSETMEEMVLESHSRCH